MRVLKNKHWLITALLAWLPLATSAEVYQLYFLGGQSNMEGLGFNSELPDDLKQPLSNVLIFQSNILADDVAVNGRGLWTALRPGHGRGFSSNGKKNVYGKQFGPELSFGKHLMT